MNTTTLEPTTDPRTQRRPGRAARIVAAALVASTLMTGMAVDSALAATTAVSGYNGGVTVYPAQGQYVTSGQNLSRLPGLKVPGPYVTRSAGSTGAQLIWLQVTVEQWYGDRWVHVADSGMTGLTLPAGQNGMFLPNRFFQLGSGHFRTKVFVYWQTTGYRNLGAFAADYDRLSDYRCSIAACRAQAGYITLY